MGAEQTLTSRNSQENVTSNNALSINDSSSHGLSLQRKASVANNTGLPDSLKSGVESLSGYSLDDVRVHYNSSKPAAVQAYAYTQGTDIHIAPGQERCLPHEAWHVTQQMSGRVSPTTSIGGVAVNDDASLEHEADVMGARASTLQGNNYATVSRKAWSSSSVRQNKMMSAIVQRESEKGGAQGVLLRDDEACIESFASKEYTEDNYSAGNFGHFKAKYTPGSRNLNVTLPVSYGSGMDLLNSEGKARKEFFKENIKNTWSEKYHINFKRSRSEVPATPGKGWESKLNGNEGTKVNVDVEDTAETGQRAFFDLSTVPDRSGVGNGYAKLREKSFEDNSVDDKRELREVHDVHGRVVYDADGNVKRAPMPSWNPTAHEAGHMFGLGDEYRVDKKGVKDGRKITHVYRDPLLKAFEKDSGLLKEYHLDSESTITHNGKSYTVNSGADVNGTFYYLEDASGTILKRSLEGTTSTHYDMVKDYFGEEYANNHALMRNGNGQRSDSIMISGSKVEAHHYVTFADAMVQAIQNEFPSVPSPDAPNTRVDWEIK